MLKVSMPGLAAMIFATSAAQAVVPVTLTTTGYVQDFNSLATSGTGSAVPAGWQFLEVGGNTTYTASDGSSNAGGAYSFGTGTGIDRALGSIGSGTVSPIRYGGFFINGLATTVTAVTLAYAGEQWRQASATADGLAFEYSLNSTDLANGTWVAAGALDFAAIQVGGNGAAINGNAAANRTLIGGTLSNLSIAAGAGFAIRWTDIDSTGTDQGLGIDDVALTLTPAAVAAVPEPATWGMMIAGFALVGSATRRRRAVRVAA